MLQINTGKLFKRNVEHSNNLRGVLYTNVSQLFEDIQTNAGVLRATGGGRYNHAIIYELLEKIEETEAGPGVLASHGVKPYLRDFSVVASFGLGAIFSVDGDVVKRLTSDKMEFSSFDPPKKFLKRFFDEQITITEADRIDFIKFVADLLALERRSFLATMRAMRTFVAGLHSIPDDLGLAYTLLVSSVETLAQGFDSHEGSWSDVAERKRKDIDSALASASADISKAVRKAIIESDNLSLATRYREFVLSKVEGEYFRSSETVQGRAIAKWQLPVALKQAYAIRSQYIHSAKPLPLQRPHNYWEVTEIDRRPVLTLQGLARLTNHTIRKFVSDGQKIETEVYDYSLERDGIIQMKLATEYWVGAPLKEAVDIRCRLEGFLQQLEAIELDREGSSLTDLRPVLQDIEKFFPQAKPALRPALYALHVLFNGTVKEEDRSSKWDDFMEKYDDLSFLATSEILITRTVSGNHKWDLKIHQEAYDKYWTERQSKSGLHAPRLFEAAFTLGLAERYREIGNDSVTLRLIAEAVEAYPGHQGLLNFESEFITTKPIIWRDILLPKEDADVTDLNTV